MKFVNKCCLFLFVLTSFKCCGQNTSSSTSFKAEDVIGVWQAERYDEGSGWPDTYQFFPDKRFIFNFSQYDGSKRILRILGTYKVENNSIVLQIENTVEAVGGHLTRSTITSLSDTWEIADYTVKTVKQNNTEPEIILIKKCVPGDYPKPCILLDGREYFRMDKDPSKYN
ncbi:MAG: hypothetical protein IT213_00830 [Cytophagales bacterium]|nr:hypothetical protein [Cytophagales bacterium]